MKLAILIFIFPYFDAIFAQCEDNEYSTVGVLDDINEEIYNDDDSVNGYSVYSWISDDLNRILSGNGIPNHEVGLFLILIILIQLVNNMLMQISNYAQL